MTGAINTNVEALKEIRDSMCRFQERIQPLQGELVQCFESIDEELFRNYKRFERQLEERRRRGTQDGQTDTFVCDRCRGRIRLKIRGDATNCREQGCHGTLHRVYRDSSYSGEQRRKDIEDMEEIRSLIKDYAEQKVQMITVFSEFFASDVGNIDSRKMTLVRCIGLLEDYLNTDLSLGTDSYSKKALEESATNSYERSKKDTVRVPLQSKISSELIDMIPQKRRSAVHTSYAKAPEAIVNALNRCVPRLSHIRNTFPSEGCHYNEEKQCIAMKETVTNDEYVDVLHHELGHFVDHSLGFPSTSTAFVNAFNKTKNTIDTSTTQGKQRLINILDDAFSTGAAYDRNVTDIISALTNNNVLVVNRFQKENVAYYQHNNRYWNAQAFDGSSLSKREKEVFANLFAIETDHYRISKNFVERWFPQLVDVFVQTI